MEMYKLIGQFLLAAPAIGDPRFARTVIYICSHNHTGAMGLIINRLYPALDSKNLFQHLAIPTTPQTPALPIHFGGPVETGRGFVLHSDDYRRDTSMSVDHGVALTATLDILEGIANQIGPRRSLIALGYSGWGPGQLEHELKIGGWLTVPGDADLLFDPDLEQKWEQVFAKLGFSPGLLSSEMGQA